MYSIFAVEPESIDNWPALRYVVEKFGYSKGLLIARYPKRWMAMVMDACRANGARDVELKRIEEKLSQIKGDRLYKMGLPYSDATWIDNVLQPEILKDLDAVLVREPHPEEKFHDVSGVAENLFDNRREIRVQRRSKALAEAAKCLLTEVESVVLVDPYFRPERKYVKVLRELVAASRARGRSVTQVVIYVAFSKSPEPQQALLDSYRKLLADLIEDGLGFSICRIKDDEIDFDFHARYLLTEKGGLRYDRGFVEPEDHSQRDHETDITCMESKLVEELRDCYRDDQTGVVPIDTLKIS